jgi:hypothetical protein
VTKEVVDGLDLGTAGPMTLMMNLRLDLVKAKHRRTDAESTSNAWLTRSLSQSD